MSFFKGCALPPSLLFQKEPEIVQLLVTWKFFLKNSKEMGTALAD